MNPADKEAGKSKIVGMGRFCAPTVFLVTAALAVGANIGQTSQTESFGQRLLVRLVLSNHTAERL